MPTWLSLDLDLMPTVVETYDEYLDSYVYYYMTTLPSTLLIAKNPGPSLPARVPFKLLCSSSWRECWGVLWTLQIITLVAVLALCSQTVRAG
eukprot:5880821-Amphidinium_carterae.2